MENGVYQINDKIAVGAKGVEVKDGKGRGLKADARLVRKSDGYMHDQFFWTVASDWMDLADAQVAFLTAKGLSSMQEIA